MAIALQDGKVVFKGSKASCTCCETGCCMYPAASLGVDYAESDLPDEVIYAGQTLTRAAAVFSNANYEVRSDIEIGQWTVVSILSGGTASYGSCLIAGPVADNYPDDLTIVITGGPEGCANNIPVSRVSLCVWRSAEYTHLGFTERYYVGYEPLQAGGTYWNINAGLCYTTTFNRTGDDKAPDGSYSSLAGYTAVVS